MHVRDRLWSQVIRSYAIWSAFIVSMFIGLGLLPENFSRLFWIPIAGLWIAIPCGVLFARIVCPQCGFPFLKTGFMALRPGAGATRINHCPHCGLHLDSEAPGATP